MRKWKIEKSYGSGGYYYLVYKKGLFFWYYKGLFVSFAKAQDFIMQMRDGPTYYTRKGNLI